MSPERRRRAELLGQSQAVAAMEAGARELATAELMRCFAHGMLSGVFEWLKAVDGAAAAKLWIETTSLYLGADAPAGPLNGDVQT